VKSGAFWPTVAVAVGSDLAALSPAMAAVGAAASSARVKARTIQRVDVMSSSG
jgi:hypothetical protein